MDHPAPRHPLMTDLARRFVPRPLRNLARSPGATARWLRGELAYRCGRAPSCRVRAGWTVRCHPSSVRPFRDFEGEEQRRELDEFVARCTPGMVLLDIGAHYGLFTLAALHYGGPAARAVAVEPSAHAHRLLWINLRLAGAEGRAEVVRAAVGDRDGTLRMLSIGPIGEHYLVGCEAPRPDARAIPQCTIPALIARTGLRPTHVKIDVEGYEEEVLRGGLDSLRALRPVLFLELHGDAIRGRERRPEAVLELAAAAGYDRLEWQGRPIAPAEAAARHLIRLVALPAAEGPTV